MDGQLLNQRYKRRTAVFAFFLATSVLFFGGVLLYQLMQLRQAGIDYSQQHLERSNALAHIHRAIGYGGLIHDFKNYVLRNDSLYLERLELDVQQTRRVLNEYRSYPLSPSEDAALRDLEQTLEQYITNIRKVERGIRDGNPIEVLDRMVRVDDSHAIAALELLQSEGERLNLDGRAQLRAKVNHIIDLLMIGLISLPLIGIWAYRHIGLLERISAHMTEKKEIERKLERASYQASQAWQQGKRYKDLAYRCTLTRIPNRQAFEEAANELLEAPGEKPFSILFVDVDDFKQINDQHGHTVGDQVLQEVAQRLAGVLREGDLVARFGGDEFAVLLQGRDIKRITARLAERIVSALREGYDAIVPGLRVSCSVGGVVGPKQGLDLEALLNLADTRMYAVKNAGKDGVRLS